MHQEVETFLTEVAKKFADLLEESPDPKAEIADAARRLESADLLYLSEIDPNWTPRQAAYKLIETNQELQDGTDWEMTSAMAFWKAAETSSELITALLPKNDSLD